MPALLALAFGGRCALYLPERWTFKESPLALPEALVFVLPVEPSFSLGPDSRLAPSISVTSLLRLDLLCKPPFYRRVALRSVTLRFGPRLVGLHRA